VSRLRSKSGTVPSRSTSSDKFSATVEAAARGASIGQLSKACGFGQSPVEIARLESRHFAQPFEELRDASDVWQATHGRRPSVFLANLGSVAHYTARATFAKNFFEAGGFDVVSSDGCRDSAAAVAAYRDCGSKIAVICSSDKLYDSLVPQVAPILKSAGARTVVLAGNPGANEAAWKESGVDRFIFLKCDVLATLQELLREEGVLAS
jgi:methylmalonyl-CoA mutase